MPKKSKSPVAVEQIDEMIRTIRGVRVMLDRDLAKIYGVPTFRFNEAIKRNRHRFPADFMFQLTRAEFDTFKSQLANSSQIAMSSGKHRGTAYRPYAFTEHGALQAANVLRSPRAVQMSVFVIRAFVKMREALRGTPELVFTPHDDAQKSYPFRQIQSALGKIGFGSQPRHGRDLLLLHARRMLDLAWRRHDAEHYDLDSSLSEFVGD
jgi:hypothetical protein